MHILVLILLLALRQTHCDQNERRFVEHIISLYQFTIVIIRSANACKPRPFRPFCRLHSFLLDFFLFRCGSRSRCCCCRHCYRCRHHLLINFYSLKWTARRIDTFFFFMRNENLHKTPHARAIAHANLISMFALQWFALNFCPLFLSILLSFCNFSVNILLHLTLFYLLDFCICNFGFCIFSFGCDEFAHFHIFTAVSLVGTLSFCSSSFLFTRYGT